jgi:cyclopropane fatty-acyl-phospholipid synthase-like methyltransferase
MVQTHALLLHHLPKGARLLEIGCGSGRDAAFLLDHGFSVTAIDPSAEMIAMALRWHPNLHGHVVQTGMPLTHGHPLLSQVFDGVVSIAAVMHIADADMTLFAAQARDMLRPEGVLFLSSSVCRDGVVNGRDKGGRLFIERPARVLQAIFEHQDFQLITTVDTADSFARDIRWTTLVMKRS